MTNGLISDQNIDPLSYGFEEVDDLLMPKKEEILSLASRDG